MTAEDRALAAIIAKLEPSLRDAFLAAIRDLREGIDFRELVAALEVGDIDRAVRALDIEPAAFNAYMTARLVGFAEAGQLISSLIPTAAAVSTSFRFDMSNPRAERWIREQAGERIVGYVQEQVETARRVIGDGYSAGRGPQDIATEVAGRINPVSKRREGGIVGLSDPQASYVHSMRERLSSGDPDAMKAVVGRFKAGKWVPGTGMTLRDRRFDAVIRKAIREGKSIPKAKVEEMVASYSNRLLRRRAEDIARTETAQSVAGARKESYRQAVEKESLDADAVTKTWLHLGPPDDDARLQHILMNNKRVVGLETPFLMPDMTPMQHAHDPAGGGRHNINCRCDTRYEIDFARGVI